MSSDLFKSSPAQQRHALLKVRVALVSGTRMEQLNSFVHFLNGMAYFE